MHAARIRDEMEWSTRRLEIDTNLRMGEEQVLDKEQSTQRKLQNLQAVREEQQRVHLALPRAPPSSSASSM